MFRCFRFVGPVVLLVVLRASTAAADVGVEPDATGSAFSLAWPNWLTSDPFHFKTQHPKSPPWSSRWVLDVLTGIEFNVTFGTASLSHTIRNEYGGKIPIAIGYNDFSGFGVGLLDAPRRTSFGLRPDIGFFSKRLVVRGLKQSIPWEENTIDVAGTCSDVQTGDPVDCWEPNDYDLRLRTIYLGPQLFGAAVIANSWVELFLLGSAALRLAEYRWIAVEAANTAQRGGGFAFVRSVTTGGAIGASFPRQHISVRVSVDYEYYLRFRYPVPLEFEGPISYDETRDIYLRPRIAVEAASISAISATLAAGLLF